MSNDRHVVLGLARARSRWFSDVARWATSGLVAVDFVKTVSVEQVKARLQSGRAFSAILVDGTTPSLDRDLFELAIGQGAAVIVVSDDTARDWSHLGAAAVVPTDMTAHDLAIVLATHSSPIDPLDRIPGTIDAAPPQPMDGFRAQVISVTGAGGAGASVIAAGLAQGLAADPAHTGSVLLADLSLDADQGLLHDAGDIIPGLLELVERHRAGTMPNEVVRSMTFEIVERRYRLLLGLRRHRDWTALRSASLRASLDALRRAFTVVVADNADDFEGERETGAVDVEERNQLARDALSLSDVVVVVGAPGISGVHGMLRSVRNCLETGFPATNLIPVLNRVPRRGRAAIVVAANEFLARSAENVTMLSPVIIPERPDVERALRDGSPLPRSLVDPVTAAVVGRLESAPGINRAMPLPHDDPAPIAVGSLGEWFDEEPAT